MPRWPVLIAIALAGVAIDAAAAEEAPSAAVVRRAPPSLRLVRPAQGRAICTPQEKQCEIGDYIAWCCRADQSCDYSYPGGCR